MRPCWDRHLIVKKLSTCISNWLPPAKIESWDSSDKSWPVPGIRVGLWAYQQLQVGSRVGNYHIFGLTSARLDVVDLDCTVSSKAQNCSRHVSHESTDAWERFELPRSPTVTSAKHRIYVERRI